MALGRVIGAVTNMSGTSALVLLSIFAASVAWCYMKLLPQRIPGIPYNKKAARSIFGDVPGMFGHKDGLMEWLISQIDESKSPVFQVLQAGGMKPFVVVSDYREEQDIMMRRSEFDRASAIGAFYSGIIPTFHMNYKTGPQWKAKRRLLQDLMSPGFLNDVAAPNIHASVQILIDLWHHKMRIANGQPFKGGEDIKLSAFDAILAFSFGQRLPTRALTTQLEAVEKMDEAAIEEKRKSTNELGGLKFDYITNESEGIEALLHVTEWIGKVVSTISGPFTFPFQLMMPSMKKKALTRALMLKDQAVKAGERLESGEDIDDENDGVKSAMDLMVKREKQLAEKEGREPKYWSQSMHDEVSFVHRPV